MVIEKTFTSGDDLYYVRSADEYSLSFLGGNDTLVTRAGTTTAYMGNGNDFVRLEAGSAVVYGQLGADRFDVYSSGARVSGGVGNDVFNIHGGSGHVFYAGPGADTFTFHTGAFNEQLFGGNGADYFNGNSQSISGDIYGQAGNDRFVGFGNQDGGSVALYGGTGNDVYRLDHDGAPRIVEHSGEGTDTVQLFRGMTYTLGANIENCVVLETRVGGGATVTGNGLANRITGSASEDTIRGLGGNDLLIGNDGLDVIDGGEGDDRIIGGEWTDWITSGPGRDVIVYNAVTEATSGPAWDYETITDWDSADMIDLSGIDANTALPGNQAFEFAGYSFGAPPTNTAAGTVTIRGFGGELYIVAHVDGDGIEDMVIALWSPAGEAALTVDNLIL